MFHGRLLDHHFNWIHSKAELLALGYGVCDSATAVGHVRVKVHPAAGLGLFHQQDVHLREAGRVSRLRSSDPQTYSMLEHVA